jgi:hypothetical protein
MQDALPENTPVRYWPGWRDGNSKLGRIRYGQIAVVGGTECQYLYGAGAVSTAHIEPLVFKDGALEVLTAAEALEVCDWPGVEDVIITDNMERIRMQKLMRGLR